MVKKIKIDLSAINDPEPNIQEVLTDDTDCDKSIYEQDTDTDTDVPDIVPIDLAQYVDEKLKEWETKPIDEGTEQINELDNEIENEIEDELEELTEEEIETLIKTKKCCPEVPDRFKSKRTQDSVDEVNHYIYEINDHYDHGYSEEAVLKMYDDHKSSVIDIPKWIKLVYSNRYQNQRKGRSK